MVSTSACRSLNRLWGGGGIIIIFFNIYMVKRVIFQSVTLDMSYLYLKFFIGYLTHVTAAILQLCMNTNFWSFLKAFPPGFFSNSTNGNYIFSVLRQKKKNPLFLDSILSYPHIKFISKFYWFSLPSKYWQIPKSEKFADAFTVEGPGSIPGLRELRSHKPHSMAKKKKKPFKF